LPRSRRTCQGFAPPRTNRAALTEPVRPQPEFLRRGRRKITQTQPTESFIAFGSHRGGRPLASRKVSTLFQTTSTSNPLFLDSFSSRRTSSGVDVAVGNGRCAVESRADKIGLIRIRLHVFRPTRVALTPSPPAYVPL